MRLNQFLAQGSGLSRRAADIAISEGRVMVNGKQPSLGQPVRAGDKVTLDGRAITPAVNKLVALLNKPVGYVCSRDGQGSKTVYELLPTHLQHLKTAGRLDKDSSGLLILTNDGQLAHELTHPKFVKSKVYKIALNKPLSADNHEKIKAGIMLDDGLSKLQLDQISNTDFTNWKVTMHEGRNRQIRRTFEALGYTLPKLHRTVFGAYKLGSLPSGKFTVVTEL